MMLLPLDQMVKKANYFTFDVCFSQGSNIFGNVYTFPNMEIMYTTYIHTDYHIYSHYEIPLDVRSLEVGSLHTCCFLLIYFFFCLIVRLISLNTQMHFGFLSLKLSSVRRSTRCVHSLSAD